MSKSYTQILNDYWGFKTFRGSQQLIIENIIASKDTLALLPTGGGKSICFQIPAIVRDGICIVISPLVALMIDQVKSLKKRKIKAECIHADLNKNEIDRILDNCIFGNVKLLYISPERISSQLFLERFKRMNISFIAVDEAHCISQWGYDFRPSYLKIKDLKKIFPSLAFLALTATATPKVCEDIQQQLEFKENNIVQDSFKRQNLSYNVIFPKDKYLYTLKLINKHKKQSTIIYVRTRKACKVLFNLLRKNNIDCTYYHAGLEPTRKTAAQNNWSSGKVNVMIATSAFGMGIDKEDVRAVINFDVPESIEAYFQEAGRAGRDSEKAFSYLLVQKKDEQNLVNRIHSSYPSETKIKITYQKFCNIHQIALGSGQNHFYELSYSDISAKTDLSNLEVYHAFRLLERSGYVQLNSTSSNSSTVMIICSRDTLLNFTKLNPSSSLILECLIRSYSGLFNSSTKISEVQIAKRVNKSVEQITKQLAELNKLKIISYEKSSSNLKLMLTLPRVKSESIVLSPEVYTNRKKADLKRVNRILDFAFNASECRERLILNYFGEKTEHNCNNCDNCIKNKNSSKKNNLLNHVEQLTESPIEADALYEELSTQFHKKDIDQIVRRMLEQGKLKINALNLIVKNPTY